MEDILAITRIAQCMNTANKELFEFYKILIPKLNDTVLCRFQYLLNIEDLSKVLERNLENAL